MAALETLSITVETLRRERMLLLGGFTVAAIGGLVSLRDVLGVPTVAATGAGVVATPFLLGGLLGMAEGSLSDGAELEEFVDRGRVHYVDLLVGWIGFMLVVAVGAAVGTLFVRLGTYGLGPFGVFFLGLLGLLLMVGTPVALQFFDVGIVVGGRSAVDSLVQSGRLAWENLGSVVGFSLVYGGIVLAATIPGSVLHVRAVESTASGPVVVSEPYLWASVVTTVVLGSVAHALSFTDKVAYSQQLYEDVPATDSTGV
ncbi:hypothetical protein BRC81_01085 [Halobacteriales archaeon QS_1_68_20]|nr:MAG: hypothetical protein BRC81_01085 [Halobacteriales archaeon QS_1_68_20]